MTQIRAIQFIGTQRSGSNLLRVMLHQHPEICAPHPPHILQVMMPMISMYGNLNEHENFKALIEDVCRLVETNPVAWNMKFDRADILARCENHSLPQVMKAVYEVKAEAKHAKFWCCKSMASVHYAEEIESSGIHPFYIFIYRDGRDVALSFKKAIVGEKHMYHLAQQWKKEQELSYALCKKVGEQRSVMLRYEEFIENPEKHLRRICQLLGIAYDQQMLNYSGSEESRSTAASGVMWSNLVKPVMKDNSKKYRQELSADELEIFERTAGSALELLGYSTETDFAGDRAFTAEEIEKFNAENRQRKMLAKNNALENDLEKRKEQDEFIASLRKRFSEYKSRVEI